MRAVAKALGRYNVIAKQRGDRHDAHAHRRGMTENEESPRVLKNLPIRRRRA
jgi:hypothetical protein